MRKPITIETLVKLEQDSRLSKTKLETFSICPYRYKLIYVDGRFEELVQSLSARMGQQFHEFAYGFFDAVDLSKLDDYATIAELESYFVGLIPKDVDKVVREWCINFCEFEARHYFRLKANGLGKEYFMPIEREFYLESDEFVGIIDRIDLLTDNTLTLLEYKTSSHWSVHHLKSELSFYAYWFNKIRPLGKKATMIGAYNPNVDRFFTHRLTSYSYSGVMRRMKVLEDAIRESAFPKKQTTFCRYCEFAKECLWE